MAVISNLDVQTRLDVRELLSRFCHAVDHMDEAGWGRLFTADAKFHSPLCGDYGCRAELMDLPRKMHEEGGGFWRHEFTNIVIDRTGNNRELQVRAYCTVTDWKNGGQPVFFADCEIVLRHTSQWQIAILSTKAVRPDGMPIVPARIAAGTRPSIN